MFRTLTHTLCLAATMLAALTACSSHTDTTEPLDRAMSVTFTAAATSRTTLISNSNLTGNPFLVYGDMTSTAAPAVIFNGTQVAHTAGAWTYADTQYWFPGRTYSFVALHPAEAPGLDISSYQNSSLSFTYNYPADYTRAADLLIATHRRRYIDAATSATPVSFGFRHLMARIDLVASVDPAIGQGSVTIHSLTLRNLGNQATFSITPAPTATQTADYTGGTWTDISGSADLFSLSGLDITLPDRSGSQTAYTHSFFPADTNPLLVIPQQLVKDNADVEIVITFSRQVDPSATPETKTLTASLTKAAVTTHGGKWDPARSYVYTFTIGVDDLIIFSSPAVQPWTDSEGGNYIIWS